MIKRALLLATVAGTLGACSQQHDDLDQWMENTRRTTHGKVAPLPGLKPYQPYTVALGQLADPFDPGRLLQFTYLDSPAAPNLKRPREMLENYELDKLDMVGTLTRKGGREALIRTPDTILVRVRPGNHLGAHFGRIVEIREDGMTVEELIQAPDGSWAKRTMAMTLREPEPKR